MLCSILLISSYVETQQNLRRNRFLRNHFLLEFSQFRFNSAQMQTNKPLDFSDQRSLVSKCLLALCEVGQRHWRFAPPPPINGSVSAPKGRLKRRVPKGTRHCVSNHWLLRSALVIRLFTQLALTIFNLQIRFHIRLWLLNCNWNWFCRI